jgi:hypothetical protein
MFHELGSKNFAINVTRQTVPFCCYMKASFGCKFHDNLFELVENVELSSIPKYLCCGCCQLSLVNVASFHVNITTDFCQHSLQFLLKLVKEPIKVSCILLCYGVKIN